MKICVYGAGAIGGALAARLALAGADVSLVARGAPLAAVREKGLKYERNGVTSVARVNASDDPRELGPQDYVITAVKAFSLPQIAPTLASLLGADTAVMYAGNGVPWWYFHGVGGAHEGRRLPRLDPGDVLWDRVGVARTIGCTVNFAAKVAGPGVVHHEGAPNRLALGEPNGGDTPRLRALADALRRAAFDIETATPVRREIWTKQRRAMTTSLIAVLTGLTSGAACGAPELRPLYRAAMAEINAAAAAYGYELDTAFDASLDAQSKSPHKPSILQDMEAGRFMEIDAMFTAPLELAHAAGVATPTLDALTALVKTRARVAGLYDV